jgi:hypothetical protein
MYRVDVYFLAVQLAEMPVLLFTPVLFTAIFYWMVGLNPIFERFLIATLCIVVVSQVGVAYGKQAKMLYRNTANTTA